MTDPRTVTEAHARLAELVQAVVDDGLVTFTEWEPRPGNMPSPAASIAVTASGDVEASTFRLAIYVSAAVAVEQAQRDLFGLVDVFVEAIEDESWQVSWQTDYLSELDAVRAVLTVIVQRDLG